jgi:hypothetical protein
MLITATDNRVSTNCEWIDPLTDPRWPRLLERHPCASVFQSRGWLEALRLTYGYLPLALTTRTPDGELSTAIVFCGVKSWLTGKRLVSVPFSDHCDLLVENEAELTEFMEALLPERNLWRYFELRPRGGLSRSHNGFVAANRYVLHRLDLSAGSPDLLQRFHKNHVVRKIRRSEHEKLVYEEGRSESLLRAFYKLQIKTRRRHGIPPQPIQWFRSILHCLPDQAKVRVAFKDGMPVASILTLTDRKTMIYKYGASDAKFHRFGGMQLLLWTTIQDACKQGCTTLDLGRSRIDSLGELAFKDHWGATRYPLVYWRYPAPRRADHLKHATGGLAGRVLSSLPDRLFVAIGASLYRHVG